VTVGGSIDAEPGSRILGKNVSVGVGPRWIFGPRFVRHGHGVHDAIHWGGRFVFAIVLLLLGWLIVTLMGARLEVLGEHLERQWPLSLAVGFLATLLVLPVFIMLLITIIGIPLAFLLMPAYVLGVLIGFFAASVLIGRFVLGRAGRGRGSNAGAMAAGVGLLVLTMLVGALLWRVGQPLTFLGGFLQAVGAIVFSVAGLCGLGALVISQFGSKRPQASVSQAPPPPGAPPPAAPMPGAAFAGPPPPPWAPGGAPYEGAVGAPPLGPPAVRISEKRILPALLLCIFFGWLGVHRFYVGKIGTGIVQVLTFGGLGIWVLIDLILIIAGAFTDQSRAKITLWT
jgi:TM2 domain-containing membrane protein YozV